MSALVAAAFKAAPSIISGISSLFGGGDETSTTINYKKLRKSAERGGFNPLTALRAGGASGFVQTHTPALASIETLGRAVSDGYAAYQNYDPHAADTAELERELMRAQLANIQERTRKSQSFNVPSATAKSTVKSRPWELGNGALPAENEIKAPEATNPHKNRMIDPAQANAEAYEDRYGDLLGGLLGGLITGGSDLLYNVNQWIDGPDQQAPKHFTGGGF